MKTLLSRAPAAQASMKLMSEMDAKSKLAGGHN
jgi:hypothetical protein